MRLIRGIEHNLSALDHGSRLAIVHHGWREKLDPGGAVLLVIPSEKALTEGAAILDAAKPIREVRPVLQAHLLHHVGGSYSFPAGCNFENGLVTRFLST